MVIIETSIFTRLVVHHLVDDDYRRLQEALVARPEAGSLMPGGGGLRKIRWGREGSGKRGGLRVIYYLALADHRILMLYIYSKAEQKDLTRAQIALLRTILEEDYP